MRTIRSNNLLWLPFLLSLGCVAALFVSLTAGGPTTADSASTLTRFAVIGDYGKVGQPALDVSNMVRGWDPEFIVTVGDNTYQDVYTNTTIDDSIGQYYHDFIYPYVGSYGQGAPFNKFWPALGNHEWQVPPNNIEFYLDYFVLPNNERYYTVTRGLVEFFIVDSDPREPHGRYYTSTQGIWLQNRLAESTAPWKVVVFHHPPFVSGAGTGSSWMNWPFKDWGATIALAGHLHHYERLYVNDFPYIVNGIGGADSHATCNPRHPNSQVCVQRVYGAMLVEADETNMTLRAYTTTNQLIDTYVMTSTLVTHTPTATPTRTSTATPTRTATASPTPTCALLPNYQVVVATGTIVAGTSQVPGSTCDSCTVLINLPFQYALYGASYAQVRASNKGTLQFVSNTSTGSNECLPTTQLNDAMMVYWDDLNTNINDTMGIYTSMQGTAPNRVFTIEWRAGFVANDSTANFEARLYEGQPKFELIYGMTRGGGFSTTVGVQKGTGERFTQHSCDTIGSVPEGARLIFDQRLCP